MSVAGVPGWLQVTAMEPDVSGTDIFASSTRYNKNMAFDMAGSEGLNGMKFGNIKLQVVPFVFPVGLSTSCQNSSLPPSMVLVIMCSLPNVNPSVVYNKEFVFPGISPTGLVCALVCGYGDAGIGVWGF